MGVAAASSSSSASPSWRSFAPRWATRRRARPVAGDRGAGRHRQDPPSAAARESCRRSRDAGAARPWLRARARVSLRARAPVVRAGARRSAGRERRRSSGAARTVEPLLAQGESLPPPPVGDSSFPVLHGLYWLTANLAERRPLLLAIDDAHWGDLESLDFSTSLPVASRRLRCCSRSRRDRQSPGLMVS